MSPPFTVAGIGCVWFLLQRQQKRDVDTITWASTNGYTDANGNFTITFPESYVISLSASLYMLVGATDGAHTTPEKAYTATIMLSGTILTAYMVSQLSVFLSQV